jgi:hypothetical protein
MQIPFFPTRPHAERARRTDARAALIMALHAAALVLFFYKPIAGMALLVVAVGLGVGVTKPLPVATAIVGLLWINDPLSDFFPMKQYTAWKDVLLLLIALGWMLRNILLFRPLVLDTPVSRPLLLIIALFIGMCAMSPSPIHAILGLKATVFYMVWFFVLPDIVHSKKDVKTLIAALLFGTFCLGVYDLWKVQQPFGTFPPNRAGKIQPGYTQTHWSGSVHLIPLGVILGMATLPSFSGWRKALIYVAVIPGVLGLLAAGSRAHWVAKGFALIVISVMGRRYGNVILLLAVALAGGLFVQHTANVDVSDRALSTLDSQDVSAQRRENETSEHTIPFVLKHPVGVGTGSMTAVGAAKVWSSSDVKLAMANGIIHNGFLLVGIEIGWLGMFAWAWMLAEGLRASYLNARDSRDPYIRNLGLGLFGMMIWFTLMHFATPMMTAPLLSVVIWLPIGLIGLLPFLDEEASAEAEIDAPAAPALAAPVGADV